MLKALKRSLMRFVVITLVVQASLIAAWLPFGIHSAKADGQTVIINEVMWMGSVGHTADVWIELKNTTSQSKDLSGWKIENSGIDASFEGKSIPADGGFFLIANYGSTDPASILNIQANIIDPTIDFDSSCSENGNLILKDNLANIVDIVSCESGNWPAGNNNTVKRSMERNHDGSGWHSSVGFVNLDSSAIGQAYATPGYVNDNSIPTSGNIKDGPNNNLDIDAQFDDTKLAGNWDGFIDSDSVIASYGVFYTQNTSCSGLSVIDCSQASAAITTINKNYTFNGLSLEDGTYYINVYATNNVGLKSLISVSNGVYINPSFVIEASDTPNDNGHSVDLSWSLKDGEDNVLQQNGFSFESYYQELGVWLGQPSTTNSSIKISTLDNNQLYNFKVKATDVWNSAQDNVSSATPLDNLAPSLDPQKVKVNWNNPTIEDTIEGSIDAVSELSTLYLYSSSEFIDANLIGTGLSNENGSFGPIEIGDNLSSEIWIELEDLGGNYGEAGPFANDIVAPNPPVISKLDVDCVLPECRVAIEWTEDSTDAVINYELQYITDGEVKTIDNKKLKSVVISLDSGKVYEIVAYAIDGAGNKSDASQLVRISLVQGVNITGRLVDGEFQITTSPVSGTLEEVQATPTKTSFLSPFVPAASAQGNNSTTPSPTPTNSPSEEAKTESSQWSRILIGALLLLVVAGSFYALSRTIGKDEEVVTPPPSNKPEEEPTSTQNKKKNKKRR